MKLHNYILIILSLALTGCFHHRHKKEKQFKSRQTIVAPEIKYIEPKKEEALIIEKPKEIEQKIEIPQQVIPGERVEEKKNDSWWPWG